MVGAGGAAEDMVDAATETPERAGETEEEASAARPWWRIARRARKMRRGLRE